MTVRPVSAHNLPREPDPVGAWIKFDLLTRHVVGRSLEMGATPETDESLEELAVLRGWVVNCAYERDSRVKSCSSPDTTSR
jgi:hypothetical protein